MAMARHRLQSPTSSFGLEAWILSFGLSVEGMLREWVLKFMDGRRKDLTVYQFTKLSACGIVRTCS